MGELEEYSVTVTVPIYNSSEYIDDCLKCISNQTYEVSEIIFVVDERTTDDSEQILMERSISFDNLRIIKQTDGNRLAGARNIGIKEAKGNVLWFLDVDDIPHPTFLEELLNIMKETDADTVVCNHFQSYERKAADIPDGEYSYSVVSGSYAAEHYTDYPIYSWSRIQKRSVFNEDSMFRVRQASEDIEQTIRQFAVSDKVCYFNKPLFNYIKNKGSSTMVNRSKELESLDEMARSLLSFIEERLPDSYPGFERCFLLNAMRQSTFSKYCDYSKWYAHSECRKAVKSIKEKTKEMKVFLMSKFLYYLVLYPFSHFLWDKKVGQWDS